MVSGNQTEASGRTGRFTLLALVLATVHAVLPAQAQQPPPEEVPLERCDRLPVVKVRADGKVLRFLLDTGATSALSLRGARNGELQRILVSSWSGTVETRASRTVIRELTIGHRQLRNLNLPAFDLEAIGRACGGRIDGFLGVDLLEELSATIDLKRFVLRLGEADLPTVSVEDRTGKGVDRTCGRMIRE